MGLSYRLSLFCLLSLVFLQAYALLSPAHNALDLWLSRDQQGYLYFKLGRYDVAFHRFENQNAKAISAYSGESFTEASELFSTLHNKEAYFNWANSLAHQEKYEEAIDAYHLALAFDSSWLEANSNLELMQVLVLDPKSVQEFDGGSQGEIGADEIVFDLDGEREKQAQKQAVLSELELDQEDLNRLWLKRLNTKVEDFLTRKFAYQLQTRQAKAGKEVRDVQ